MPVFFFDIGGTLADVTRRSDGALVFTPLPRVIQSLEGLAGYRKGIISNPGEGALAQSSAAAALKATFSTFFNEAPLVHWGSKDRRAIFDLAIASAAELPQDCIFIGEDAMERQLAREAGMRIAPHPVFSRAALEARPVFWAKATLPTGTTLADMAVISQDLELVPLHVPSSHIVLMMATSRAIATLQDAGYVVDLRGDVGAASAYLLRDDRTLPPSAGFSALSEMEKAEASSSRRAAAAFAYVAQQTQGFGSAVTSLGPAPGGVYLIAKAGTQIEEVHIPGGRHGHTERLLPDPSLLTQPDPTGTKRFSSAFAPAAPSSDLLGAIDAVITSELMRSHIARLSGAEPLETDDGTLVTSRHIDNVGNTKAVEFIRRQLTDLSFPVKLQEFSYRGARLHNVEAEFQVPGTDGIVLITAHLDSTASLGHFEDDHGEHRDYLPAVDPAPGADDDASGVAAVLAAAKCLRRLLDKGAAPSRSVRFVFFNAEEQGLLGSKFYARAAAQAGDHIIGVFQMDMIGGFQGGDPKVEIHAGCGVPGPAADASNQLAEKMAHAVKYVAPQNMEIQRLTGPSDPATGRSDHASFHERGWAAIAVSENFFPDTEPASGTEQYHLPGDLLADQHMNTDYAATIARAVACAGLALAGL